MSFLSYSSGFQGIVDVFMRDPRRYLPFAQLMAGIMDDEESALSKPQRETIARHVSKLNNCHYCVGSHEAVLANLAADEDAIADTKMAPVLAFATKLTQDPGAVTQTDINAMRDAGWSDQAVEDVINIVSLFSYLNRLADGFGIKGSAEVFAQAGGMIAQHGYGPVVRMIQEKAAT